VSVRDVVVVVGLLSVRVSRVEVCGRRGGSGHSVTKLAHQHFSEEVLPWGGLDERRRVFNGLVRDNFVQVSRNGFLGGWAVHHDMRHGVFDSVEFSSFFFIGGPGTRDVFVRHPPCNFYTEGGMGEFLFRSVRSRGGRHGD